MSQNPLMLLAVVTAFFLSLGVSGIRAAEVASNPTETIRGLWVWHEDTYTTSEARKSLLDFAQQQNLNMLMVQVHRAPGAEGQPPQFKHPEAYRSLVIEAGDRGIAIEALDGAPDMGMRKNQARSMQALEMIIAFNASLPADRQLAGVHYDIEPYVMPEWKTDQREQIMRETLEFFTGAAARLRVEAPRLSLACDIPFWYDNKTAEGDTCELEFLGTKKNFHQHLQDVTDYVGIMSYRRKAEGGNSVSAVIESERAYAEKIGRFICASLETGKVNEAPTISFFGTTAEAYRETLAKVEEVMTGKPGYGGVLIHQYKSLRDLLEKPAAAAAAE